MRCPGTVARARIVSAPARPGQAVPSNKSSRTFSIDVTYSGRSPPTEVQVGALLLCPVSVRFLIL